MVNRAKYFFLSLFVLSAQIVLAQDTINIPEVFVLGESDIENHTQSQVMDSLLMTDPSNKDLGEGLQKFSHAFVKSYGIGSLATISLRGSGSNHTNLNWNGTQLNNASNGVVDFSLIPPFFIENVAISYGQSSLQYGAGGLGGAVKMDNSVDFSSPQKISFEQEFGSFNFHSTGIAIRSGKGKIRSVSKFLYRGASNNFEYSDLSEEGFPKQSLDHAEMIQKGIMQSLHYRPNQNNRVDLHFWYFNSNRELPNMMSLRDLEESQFDENLRLQLGLHHYFDLGKLSFNSTVLRDKIIYQNNQLDGVSESLNRSYRNFLKAEIEWKGFMVESRLDLDLETAEQLNYEGGTVQRGRQALFASLSRELGSYLKISVSGREELIAKDLFILPQLRMDWKLSEGKINYWVLVGKNMKYPSLNDLYWSVGGNQRLEAEESKSAEFGQFYQWKINRNDRLGFKLTTYYSIIDNYIQWAPTNLGFWRAENIQKVESKGVELDLNLELKRKLKQKYSFIYNYVSSVNLVQTRAEDESVGKQLIYVPEHQLNLNGQWHYKGFGFNANWQFVSARYLRSDNSAFLPYYQLIDLSLNRQWALKNDLLSIGFSVKNLLDTEYQAIQWRPMPGRNYMITLKYTIK